MSLPGGAKFDSHMSKIDDSSLGLPAACPLQPHFTLILQGCDRGMTEQLNACSSVEFYSPLTWHSTTGCPRVSLYMEIQRCNSGKRMKL